MRFVIYYCLKAGEHMKQIKRPIELSDEEKTILHNIIADPNESKRTVIHAKILLESDISNSEHLTKEQLASKLNTTHTTIQFVRDRYHQSGFSAALYKNYSNGSSNWKLTPEIVEQILELAKTKPTDGHERWSLRRLCEACEKQGIVDSVSNVRMMKLLKEHNIEL